MAARFDTRAISILVAKDVEPAARSKILANAARTGVAELISTGGASPKYTRFVDGTKDAVEDSVRPDGAILYQFGYLGEIVVFAVAFLQARSPVRSGAYRKSFVVSINGRPIPAASVNPANVPHDAEVFVFNVAPYARKVDVQLVGGRPLRFKVPPGLFEDAAKAVNSRFGNAMTARRLYNLKFPGQASNAAGRALEYPALVISRR
jgi:hypothetical protein